jgi:integration host factor subunit beta
MTKAALVNHVAATVQLPKNQTAAVLTDFLQGRVDALHGGDQVALRGFGSFRLRQRQGAGRTPPTHRQHDPDPSQSDPLVDRGHSLPRDGANRRRHCRRGRRRVCPQADRVAVEDSRHKGRAAAHAHVTVRTSVLLAHQLSGSPHPPGRGASGASSGQVPSRF